MTTTDNELDEFHPLVQMKKAQKMFMERKISKIQFVLTTPQGVIPCQWIDPFMGAFRIKSKMGVMHIDQLPEGSLIIGQHFVKPNAEENPCDFCNSMGNLCPYDSMCDVYTAYKEKVSK